MPPAPFPISVRCRPITAWTPATLPMLSSELRERLDALRAELDRYLASEYGVRDGDEVAYKQWRTNHEPFHWFIEFYGIMHRGGFDVIVGNPPYVEYRAVKDYRITGYETLSCGNLYAFVLERSYDALRNGGRMGMIVQLSLSCTERMAPIQEKLSDLSNSIWFAHFDDRPPDSSKDCSIYVPRLSSPIGAQARRKTLTLVLTVVGGRKLDLSCLTYCRLRISSVTRKSREVPFRK